MRKENRGKNFSRDLLAKYSFTGFGGYDIIGVAWQFSIS